MTMSRHLKNTKGRRTLKACCIFDGDDTLWQTMNLYEIAKTQYAKIMTRFGVPPEFALEELDKIDARNVKRHGFSITRFPNSLDEAYRLIMKSSRQPISKVISRRLFRIGANVFQRKARLRPGARKLLKRLASRNLVLLTKGDPRIQRRRIKESGLKKYFSAIHIVPTKNKFVFREIIKKERIDVNRSWSIGDSLKSDILPALEVGLSGLWVQIPTWIYEEIAAQPKSTRFQICSDLNQVATIIEKEL